MEGALELELVDRLRLEGIPSEAHYGRLRG